MKQKSGSGEGGGDAGDIGSFEAAENGQTAGLEDAERLVHGRLRVLGMRATLTLGVPAAALEHLDRVLASFEQYCTVTQSVAQGFPVEVQVVDATGVRVK